MEHRSDDLDQLIQAWLEGPSGLPRTQSIFEPLILVVPNMQMGRYIERHLARTAGICPYLNVQLPGQFMWQLVRQRFPDMPVVSHFDVTVMPFKLMPLLQDRAFQTQFADVGQYLQRQAPVNAFQLALRVADLFEQYQLYRTDMLDAWAEGRCITGLPDESWQQALWCRLLDGASDGDRPRYHFLQQLLEAPDFLSSSCPVTLVDDGRLPPGFEDLLTGLSLHGRVTRLRLGDAPANALEAARLPDSSRLVSCSTEMREVEALHDDLVNQLEAYPGLVLDRIRVMTPDPGRYAPLFRAVFDQREPAIAWQLVDRIQAGEESPLVQGISQLLEMPRWRFTRDEVDGFMRNPLVRRRFMLADDDLLQIQRWLDDAAVCWGRDAAHRQQLSLPKTDANSWRQGLDRLLLGLMLPREISGEDGLYAGRLPADQVEGNQIWLLSRLVSLCERLFEVACEFASPCRPSGWQERLQRAMADCFVIGRDEQPMAQDLLSTLDSIVQYSSDDSLDAPTFLAMLTHALPGHLRGGGTGGSLSLGRFDSQAGLPTDRLYLLGMNFGAWPSAVTRPGFDLMQALPREGDRDPVRLDRHLVQQALRANRGGLFASYVGRNIRTGEDEPPSVILSEWMDQLPSALVPLLHPMNPFSSDNFRQTYLQSHQTTWLEVARRIGRGQNSIAPLVREPLAATEWPRRVELEDFIRFFVNPARGFLRARFNMVFENLRDPLPRTEPFALDNFVDNDIRQRMVAQPESLGSDAPLRLARAAGEVPPGPYGDALFDRVADEAKQLLDNAPAGFFEVSLPPVRFSLDCLSDTVLHGQLEGLRTAGQWLLIAKPLHDYECVGFWLRHLVLCVLAPSGIQTVTRVRHSGGEVAWPHIDDAKAYLQAWMAAWRQGLCMPLPFFPRSSRACAEDLIHKAGGGDKKDGDRPSKLSKAWPYDRDKPLTEYVYRDHDPSADPDFETLAARLLVPMLQAMEVKS